MSDTENVMQVLAQLAQRTLNGNDRPGSNGFVILAFPFDKPEGGRTNYISNCARKDVVAALKEIVARFEGQPQQSGRA